MSDDDMAKMWLITMIIFMMMWFGIMMRLR